MAEKGLEVLLTIESVWEKREKFLELNPAAEVPVLVEEDNTVLSDSDAICEYLEAKYPEPRLMPVDLYEKAEVRRLTGWFDKKFYKEVGELLLIEKILKQLKGVGEPDSRIIRVAQKNMHFHLKYFLVKLQMQCLDVLILQLVILINQLMKMIKYIQFFQE